MQNENGVPQMYIFILGEIKEPGHWLVTVDVWI